MVLCAALAFSNLLTHHTLVSIILTQFLKFLYRGHAHNTEIERSPHKNKNIMKVYRKSKKTTKIKIKHLHNANYERIFCSPRGHEENDN